MQVGRRVILCAFFALSACVGSLTVASTSDRHEVYDGLLAKYVEASPDGINRVHYKRWKDHSGDRRALDNYIDGLAAMQPSKMSRDEAFAYWGNLYNAITLKVVLDAYPVKSIKEISSPGAWLDPKAWLGGPWRAVRVRVEERNLSLDDIEHGILRPNFRDPRVHYMLNCASIGCPNLAPRAWRPDTLDQDLDRAARDFINHPRGVALATDGEPVVSSIFRWFAEDFGGSDAATIAHLIKYAEPALAAVLKSKNRIGSDRYDWSLNAAVRK